MTLMHTSPRWRKKDGPFMTRTRKHKVVNGWQPILRQKPRCYPSWAGIGYLRKHSLPSQQGRRTALTLTAAACYTRPSWCITPGKKADRRKKYGPGRRCIPNPFPRRRKTSFGLYCLVYLFLDCFRYKYRTRQLHAWSHARSRFPNMWRRQLYPTITASYRYR